MRTSNITASNQLFLSNPVLIYWRFEVVYTFDVGTSVSAQDFLINQPPHNGSCSIAPLNGTTSTSFTVSCIHWLDEHDIEDYALYSTTRAPVQRHRRLIHASACPCLGYTSDIDDPSMIAFSPLSTFQVQLPAGSENTSLVQLFIYVRDTYDGVASFNITPVTVLQNPADDVHPLITSVMPKDMNPMYCTAALGGPSECL